MVKIMTDLSADITKAQAAEFDIKVLPFYINYPDESILADIDYTPEMFYEKFKSTAELPATSQATPGILEDMYREIGKNQPIIHITIPANGSGIVNTALNVSSRLNEEEGFDITVVDSSMYSLGTGVNVIEAAQMAANGAGKAEIIGFLRERFEKDRVYFIVDDLKCLQKGGRIKATTMVVSKALDIKPILWSNDGMVEAFAKVKGLKKAISKMVEIVTEKMENIENGTVYVITADVADKAELTETMLKKAGIKNIAHGKVGPIIACHAGIEVFGIYFRHK